jgi:hypothetical protein
MSARSSGGLSAVVAGQRGRARLRRATIALGAVSLAAAGAVAYHLPGTGTTAAGTSVVMPGSGATVHATSGGSGITTATAPGGSTSGAPAASTGRAHATSGGS